MAYPRELLNEGEEVLLDIHPHWVALAKPGLLVLLGIVIAVLVQLFGPQPIDDVVRIISLAPLVLAVLVFLVRYVVWRTEEFVITSERLVRRSGVIAKKGLEIPLERVNNIAFNQSVFERLLRSGDLIIESAGEMGRQQLPNIGKPAAVQNHIYRAIEAQQARDADRMAGRRAPSVAEELERLDDLRRRGVLTDAEFAAQKAQLLGGS